MDKEDYLKLSQKTDEELADIYHGFNCYDYPEEFKHLARGKDEPFIYPEIMTFIEGIVGHELIMRSGNNKDMSDEEFRDFYDGTYKGDEEAKRRYEIRNLKEILKKYNIDGLLDWTKTPDEIMEDAIKIKNEKTRDD